MPYFMENSIDPGQLHLKKSADLVLHFQMSFFLVSPIYILLNEFIYGISKVRAKWSC